MKNRSLVSINDYSADEIQQILDLAEDFEREPNQPLLKHHVIASLFYEPSTRTRLSFESAINRLGGRIVGFSETASTSVSKGETLKDTIMMVANYSDLIVMRHPLEGSAQYASEISSVPVVNAGDGAHQHPTQTLLDLYSIRKTQGKLEKLNICLVGDLKYGRTVHSLLMAMIHFNPVFHFIAPDELMMPIEYKLLLNQKGIEYHEHKDLAENIESADIIYMTRVQRERFSDPLEYEKVKNVYILKNQMLDKTKPNVKILHPLPRVNEISTDVDSNSKAYYFTQALNGVYTRMAILSKILGAR